MATGETAREQRIAELVWLRELMQAIVDDNRDLVKSPSQQAFAERRIVDATRQLDELNRELAELRPS